MRAAVQVGLKPHAFIGDISQRTQTEYLKPATVGKDGSIPGHESMQSSQLSDRLRAWSQEQVVRVAEQYLDIQFFQLIRGHRFHCGLGPDRHEDRRLDHAMRGMQPSTACPRPG